MSRRLVCPHCSREHVGADRRYSMCSCGCPLSEAEPARGDLLGLTRGEAWALSLAVVASLVASVVASATLGGPVPVWWQGLGPIFIVVTGLVIVARIRRRP